MEELGQPVVGRASREAETNFEKQTSIGNGNYRYQVPLRGS